MTIAVLDGPFGGSGPGPDGRCWHWRRHGGAASFPWGISMRLTFRLAAAMATGLLLAACGSAAQPPASRSPSPRASSPATPAASTPAPAPAPAPAGTPFGYQPLFPFASLADAQAWQASYASGGHQPWHLSADLTAVAFSQGYLGFSAINKVAGHSISGGDAHVTVGLTLPNGHISSAAIIHLVKYGTGKNVPWEVVGTDDTGLTLDVPAYGSTVTSPVKIGGTITGVDENLRADVRTLGTAPTVGTFCCLAAGGQASPWSFTVPFQTSPGQVITIVVHTGGHVAPVERFAVTGARVG
jgi:acyl dehydratase